MPTLKVKTSAYPSKPVLIYAFYIFICLQSFARSCEGDKWNALKKLAPLVDLVSYEVRITL